jgi:large subunit ribosomal protein L18
MASTKQTSRAGRQRRHVRVRRKITGTAARPRLAVFRSNQHIYAQVIDDEAGSTLFAASDLEASLRDAGGTKTETAARVGALVAQRATAEGVDEVVLDRGGFRFAGRVRAFAEAARKEGLAF